MFWSGVRVKYSRSEPEGLVLYADRATQPFQAGCQFGFVDVLSDLVSLGGSRQLGNYRAYQVWSFC